MEGRTVGTVTVEIMPAVAVVVAVVGGEVGVEFRELRR